MKQVMFRIQSRDRMVVLNERTRESVVLDDVVIGIDDSGNLVVEGEYRMGESLEQVAGTFSDDTVTVPSNPPVETEVTEEGYSFKSGDVVLYPDSKGKEHKAVFDHMGSGGPVVKLEDGQFVPLSIIRSWRKVRR